MPLLFQTTISCKVSPSSHLQLLNQLHIALHTSGQIPDGLGGTFRCPFHRDLEERMVNDVLQDLQGGRLVTKVLRKVAQSGKPSGVWPLIMKTRR